MNVKTATYFRSRSLLGLAAEFVLEETTKNGLQAVQISLGYLELVHDYELIKSRYAANHERIKNKARAHLRCSMYLVEIALCLLQLFALLEQILNILYNTFLG